LIKLRIPSPNPDQVQTVKLRARFGASSNTAQRDMILEFIKVMAVNPMIQEQDGLFGPYLVLAGEWKRRKSFSLLTGLNIKLYPDPSLQSMQEQQRRKNAAYDIDIENDAVYKDHALTTDTGYYPHKLLISVSPTVTKANFKQAMKTITSDPRYISAARQLAIIKKQQEKLNSRKEKLERGQHDFTVKCATILLTGFSPLGENTK